MTRGADARAVVPAFAGRTGDKRVTVNSQSTAQGEPYASPSKSASPELAPGDEVTWVHVAILLGVFSLPALWFIVVCPEALR